MKTANYTNTLVLTIGIFFILFIGKSILLPFLFAVLLYYIIRSIRRFMDRSKFVREYFPSWSKNILASGIVFYILIFIVGTIISNAQSLPHQVKSYENNILLFISEIKHIIGDPNALKLQSSFESLNFSSLANIVINSISSFAGNVALVIFYVLFLILEESSFSKKLKLIFSSTDKYSNTVILLNNIEHSITHYIGIKTLISFISAVICFVILYFTGLSLPFLWASFIFVFSFIPVIGTFLAIAFPFLYSILQFGNLTMPLTLLILLSSILLLITNILEPKLMGKSLNISPLVALLSLAVWGSLWGIAGMIISIPITVILIILLANFEKTRWLAILLSNNGEV